MQPYTKLGPDAIEWFQNAWSNERQKQKYGRDGGAPPANDVTMKHWPHGDDAENRGEDHAKRTVGRRLR